MNMGWIEKWKQEGMKVSERDREREGEEMWRHFPTNLLSFVELIGKFNLFYFGFLDIE